VPDRPRLGLAAGGHRRADRAHGRADAEIVGPRSRCSRFCSSSTENALTMMAPLVTIGISLITAQGASTGRVEKGLGVSAQTHVFMGGVMFGAGTDYTVFLIRRYHDHTRLGNDSDQAVKRVLTFIRKLIAVPRQPLQSPSSR
jgi:hypothetical protein